MYIAMTIKSWSRLSMIILIIWMIILLGIPINRIKDYDDINNGNISKRIKKFIKKFDNVYNW